MEMQRTSLARGVDRLNNLPESILLHILSLLPHSKQVVRTSILSTRWKFLWMSVPVFLEFYFPDSENEKIISDFLASTDRELFHWRSCEKIRTLRVVWYDEGYVKDVDLLLLFATKVANVETFNLDIVFGNYQFPQFAYKSTSLRNLELNRCKLNPSGWVNWTSLLSLSIKFTNLTDDAVEKVLSGCPNLERLALYYVFGFNRLEIASTKLRELILDGSVNDSVEVLAPYIQTLKLSGFCFGVRLQPRNVASLITVVFGLTFSNSEDDDAGREEEVTYLKELLHSFAHVQNLELNPWGIECLSILELEGWQCPPLSQKYLKINSALKQLDFPGICNFLRSSVDLETLVIDWYDYQRVDLLSFYTNEDEQNRRYEMHNFNFSLLHLKTIKIINFHGPLSGNKFILSLVEYFLKNAIVLEKFIIVAKIKGSDVSRDYVKMEQEFLSFPRSSPRASVVFSY